MAYTRKTWKNRKSEYPTRRTLEKENGDTELVTVARSEGMISEEGDAFSAENMNHLENRIAEAFDAVPTSVEIKEIVAVSQLPPDAASHPTTLYLVEN